MSAEPFAAALDRALCLHSPKGPEVGERMDEVRRAMRGVGELVSRLPAGIERDQAALALRTLSMWSIAAIALNQDDLAPPVTPHLSCHDCGRYARVVSVRTPPIECPDCGGDLIPTGWSVAP